jgi:hypothetical protein
MKKLLIVLMLACLVFAPMSGAWAVNESKPATGR